MGGHGVENTRLKHRSSENRLCPAEWMNIKLRTAGQARPYIMAWVELLTPIGTDRTQSKDETVRGGAEPWECQGARNGAKEDVQRSGGNAYCTTRLWRGASHGKQALVHFGELPGVLIWLDSR